MISIQNQKGQSLIEYLIIVALVAVGSMGVMRVVSQSVQYKFSQIAKTLGATVEGSSETPTVREDMLKKKDLTNFMQGARSQ